MRHFANLQPHEHEMLACAFEECGEAIQAIGKANRNGLYLSYRGRRNADAIARELGQIAAVTEMLFQLKIIDRLEFEAGIDEKWEKIGEYLHHVIIADDRHGNRRRAMTLTQWRRQLLGRAPAGTPTTKAKAKAKAKAKSRKARRS